MTEKELARLERLRRNENILQEIQDEKENEKKMEFLENVNEYLNSENFKNKEILEEIIDSNSHCYSNENIKLSEEHKQAIKDELYNLINSNEFKKLQNKKELKNIKRKKEFSKKVTISVIILAFLFIIFVCYEMHRLQTVEPVAYIGAGIVIMLAICVKAYMKRAYQKDLVEMKVIQTEKLSELKERYGDNFVYEHIEDITLDGT